MSEQFKILKQPDSAYFAELVTKIGLEILEKITPFLITKTDYRKNMFEINKAVFSAIEKRFLSIFVEKIVDWHTFELAEKDPSFKNHILKQLSYQVGEFIFEKGLYDSKEIGVWNSGDTRLSVNVVIFSPNCNKEDGIES